MEIEITAQMLIWLGVLIPVATGLLTKLESSSGVKAVIAIVLSVILGVIAEQGQLEAGQTLDLLAVGESAFVAFVANIASYLGVWKPIGKDESVPLQKATADFGFAGPLVTRKTETDIDDPEAPLTDDDFFPNEA